MARGVKTGGRQKGTPNKATGEIKDMIRDALDQAGGTSYLLSQAVENPVAFMTLIGKVIPKDVNNTVTGADGGPMQLAGTINVNFKGATK
jgi:hypothetical protein